MTENPYDNERGIRTGKKKAWLLGYQSILSHSVVSREKRMENHIESLRNLCKATGGLDEFTYHWALDRVVELDIALQLVKPKLDNLLPEGIAPTHLLEWARIIEGQQGYISALVACLRHIANASIAGLEEKP